jgi:transposase
MDTHKNAPLTPKGREAMVRSVIEGGLTKTAAAGQFNTTAKRVVKWVGRFRAEGTELPFFMAVCNMINRAGR